MSKSLISCAAALILLFSFASAEASAQADPLGNWVRESGSHKIAGYIGYGLAGTALTLGALGSDVHPYFGAATAGVTVSAAALGLIGYRGNLSYAWPHVLLNSLAATGFMLNAFVFEGGSPAHIASAIAGTVSMTGAIGYIIAVTRE
jgi:hypothetical protein